MLDPLLETIYPSLFSSVPKNIHTLEFSLEYIPQKGPCRSRVALYKVHRYAKSQDLVATLTLRIDKITNTFGSLDPVFT